MEGQILTSNREAYSRKEVVDIIKTMREGMDKNSFEANPSATMYNGLKELIQHIEKMREDVGVLNPSEISDTHIPTATDELDAVIGSTEEATEKIMDSCDAIQAELEGINTDQKAKIEQAVMDIFEACSFQDITGQRISKVVNSLKHIEHKVEGMISAFNGQEFSKINDAKPIDKELSVNDEQSLLNGPALATESSVDQSEIDKLLAEFD